jgi:hypothetical protein
MSSNPCAQKLLGCDYQLGRKYKVQGIPSLVVLDGNGEVITLDGRMNTVKDRDAKVQTTESRRLECPQSRTRPPVLTRLFDSLF